MKLKRMLAGMSAVATMVTCLSNVLTGGGGYASLIASAESTSEALTYGEYLSYQQVDEDDDGTYDYVMITDCDESVTSIKIPNAIGGLPVSSIGKAAFRDCTNLASAEIPDSVTFIGTDAFRKCESLTEIIIPGSVANISDRAFYYCYGLKSVTINEGAASIGEYAFRNCSKLERVNLPDSITEIYVNAFDGCGDFVIYCSEDSYGKQYASKYGIACNPTEIEAVGSYTYPLDYGSRMDLNFIAPETGEYYFNVSGEKGLDYTVGGGSNKTIECTKGQPCTIIIKPGGYSWSEGDREDVTVKIYKIVNEEKTLEELEEYTLEAYTKSNITFTADKPIDMVVDSNELNFILYNSKDTSVSTSYYNYILDAGTYTLQFSDPVDEDTIISIKSYTQSGLGYTKNTVKDDDGNISQTLSVRGIDKTLKSITIPSEFNGLPVTAIGSGAFKGFTELNSITIADSVTEIGSDAFSGTALFENQTGIKYADNWVVGCDADAIDIEIKEGTKGIASRAFDECTELQSATIPDSVTTIPDDAFNRSVKDKLIIYCDEDSYAYEYAKNLGSVVNPGRIENIGKYDFTLEFGENISKSFIPPETGEYYFDISCEKYISWQINGNSNENVNCTAGKPCTILIQPSYWWEAGDVEDVTVKVYKVVNDEKTLEELKEYKLDDYTKVNVTFTADEPIDMVIDSSVTKCYITDSSKIDIISKGDECNYILADDTYILMLGPVDEDTVINIKTQAQSGLKYYENTIEDDKGNAIGKTLSVKGADKTLESIVIPSEFLGLPVTKIESNAFEKFTKLSSITIADSVTEIGSGAFSGTALLENQTGVKYADKWVVGCDTDIAEAEIKEGTKGIASYAFEGCDKLNSITIPDSVTSIGDIFGGIFGGNKNVIIYGGKGSYAESYALENGYVFNPTKIENIGKYDFTLEYGSSINAVFNPPETGEYYFVINCDKKRIQSEINGFGFSNPIECTEGEQCAIFVQPYLWSKGDKEDVTVKVYKVVNDEKTLEELEKYQVNAYTMTNITFTVDEPVDMVVESSGLNYDLMDSDEKYISTNYYNYILESETYTLKFNLVDEDTIVNINSYEKSGIGYKLNTFTDYDENITEQYLSVVGADKTMETITVPSEFNSLPVKSIEYNAFADFTNLSSITIPDSITEIGEGAFKGTALIKNQTGVKYADIWVVDCDVDIIDAEIKEGTKGIADSAFSGCSDLQSVTIPDSVTSIAYGVFGSNESIIIYGSKGSEAETYANKYNYVFNPEKIEIIGKHEFSLEYGKEINAIFLAPESGEYNFKVTCSNEIYEIIDGQYQSNGIKCTKGKPSTLIIRPRSWQDGDIEDVTIEIYKVVNDKKTLEEMKTYTVGAYTQTNIEFTVDKPIDLAIHQHMLNSSLYDSKGDLIFLDDDSYNYSLESGTYTLKLNSVEEETVININSYDKSGLTYYMYGVLDEDGNITGYELIVSGSDKTLESAEIPSEFDGLPVTRIASQAFANVKDLNSVTIADSITYIGEDAFKGTALIKNQTGIKYADNWAVDCDADVVNAEIKEGTKGIAAYAFKNCTNLQSVTIPDSVTSIAYAAFGYDNESLIIYGGEDSYAKEYASEHDYLYNPAEIKELGTYEYKLTYGNYIGALFYPPEDGNYCFEVTCGKGIDTMINGSYYYDNTAVACSSDNPCRILVKPEYYWSYVDNADVKIKIYKVIEEEKALDELKEYSIPSYTQADIIFTAEKPIDLIVDGNGLDFEIHDSKGNNLSFRYYYYNYLLDAGTYTLHVDPTEKDAVINVRSYSRGNYLYELYDYSYDEDGNIINRTLSIKGYDISAEEVVIPSEFDGLTVESVGYQSFRNFENLASVTIPDSITSISYGAFSGCTNLEIINVSEDNKYYTSVDNVLYTKDMKALVQYPAGKKDKEYTIPDGVESIVSDAFNKCNNLTELVIPDSVTYIDEDSYSNFSNLTICANSGSYAEKYAETHKLKFKSLNGSTETTTTAVTTTSTTSTSVSNTNGTSKETSENKISTSAATSVSISQISSNSTDKPVDTGIATGSETNTTGKTTGSTSVSISQISSSSTDKPVDTDITTGSQTAETGKTTGSTSVSISQVSSNSTDKPVGTGIATGSETNTTGKTTGSTSVSSSQTASNSTEKPVDTNITTDSMITSIDNTTETTLSSTSVSNTDVSSTGVSNTGVSSTGVSNTDISSTAVSSTDVSSTDVSTTLIGDANLDGIVNIRDAATIARMAAQGKLSELPKCADYNGDGIVNIRDAAAIARYMANKQFNK